MGPGTLVGPGTLAEEGRRARRREQEAPVEFVSSPVGFSRNGRSAPRERTGFVNTERGEHPVNRGTRQFSNARTAFVLACLAATLALGTIRAPVANAQPEAPHCIGGTDLNELYGISDQIVAPFCLVANAGQQWIATSRWFVKREFEEIPVGFVPAGDTPLEDAMAKLLGVTYLIDAGTTQERSIFLPNDGNLLSIDLGGGDFPVL